MTVDDQRILVGFQTDDEQIAGAVRTAEDVLELGAVS